jgi:rhomboid protease GluP
LYLLSALGGNVLSYLMTPNPSVGASTAIFGLVAAEGVFIFQNRRLFGNRAGGMLTNLLMIIGLNLTLGLTSRGIDNWGHFGGLIAGLVFAWFAGPRMDVLPTPEGRPLLADTRSATAAWATGIALAVIFIAVAVWRSGIILQ